MAKQIKQKDLIILAAVTAIVIVAFLVFSNRNASPNNVTPTSNSINSSKDLDSASKQLDQADLNQIDTELNTLGTDTSGI